MRSIQIEDPDRRIGARTVRRAPMNISTQILLLILFATALAILAFAATAVLT